MSISLHLPYNTDTLSNATLAKRIAMAPMTHDRAIYNVTNELMLKYFGDRTAAGLIITKGTSLLL